MSSTGRIFKKESGTFTNIHKRACPQTHTQKARLSIGSFVYHAQLSFGPCARNHTTYQHNKHINPRYQRINISTYQQINISKYQPSNIATYQQSNIATSTQLRTFLQELSTGAGSQTPSKPSTAKQFMKKTDCQHLPQTFRGAWSTKFPNPKRALAFDSSA